MTEGVAWLTQWAYMSPSVFDELVFEKSVFFGVEPIGAPDNCAVTIAAKSSIGIFRRGAEDGSAGGLV